MIAVTGRLTFGADGEAVPQTLTAAWRGMRHLREHQEKRNDLEEVEPCQAAAIVSFEDVA